MLGEHRGKSYCHYEGLWKVLQPQIYIKDFTHSQNYARHFHSLIITVILWCWWKKRGNWGSECFTPSTGHRGCKWQCWDSNSLSWVSILSLQPGPLPKSSRKCCIWVEPWRTTGTLSCCHLQSGREDKETKPGKGAKGLSHSDEQPLAATLRGWLTVSVMTTHVPQGGFRGSVNPPDALTHLCLSHSSS